MLELLQSGASFEKISIANDLDRDNLTQQIITAAEKRRIPIEKVPIQKMVRRRSGLTREVLVGYLIPENIHTLRDILDDLHEKDRYPFFLLINRVDFESNIGVIARTAFAAGINGLIFQGDEEKFLNEETVHISMGAIMRIPLVKMTIFEALKEMQKNGIATMCLQMGGEIYSDVDLSGPVAFVVGAEEKGVSDEILERCDKKISIPMRDGIDSLNVGVSTAIVLYEKIRQDGKVL